MSEVSSNGATGAEAFAGDDVVPSASGLEGVWARHEPTRLLLDSAHDAFVSMDTRGAVTGWNAAAEAMFGWTAAEALGRQLGDLIVPPAFREAHREGVRRFAERGEGRMVDRRIEVPAVHREGHELVVELTISPMRIWGQLTFNAFMHDITERKRTEADLKRLAEIVEDSGDAIISVTPDGVVTSWNRGAERLYGYTAAEMIRHSVEPIIPVEQREENARLRARLRTGEPVSYQETQRRRKDGSTVDVALTISPMHDAEGTFTGLSSIAHDITDRKRAERALDEAHERFEGAFRNAPIGMALVGLDGRFLSVNQSLCELSGRSESELLASGIQEITHPDDVEADVERVEQLLAGGLAPFELEKRFVRPDGSVLWVQVSVSLVRDPAGAPLYFIRQMQDIDERKQSEEELRRYAEHLNALALQDPATGVGNRRGFDAALDEEVARHQRHGGCFSLALFDVDRFWRLNDVEGQEAGDRALRAVAGALRSACRASDTAARTGGDEFALILPGTDAEGARVTAERVQQEVAALDADITISAGVAEWPADAQTREHLLAEANRALDAAKPIRRDAPEPEGGALATRTAGTARGVERVLAIGREHLEMDIAFVSEFRADEEVLEVVVGDGASFGVAEGTALPRADSYCQRMVDGRLDNVVSDAREHPVTRDLPVTRKGRIGSYVGVPLRLSDGSLYGTLCALSHEARPDMGAREASLMHFLAQVVTERLEDQQLEASDRRAQIEVAGIHALVAALEARDHYTGEHSKTVVELATAVARELGLPESQVLEVEQVTVLHDIGKVGIPDAVLQKRGPLTEQEWQLMHQHPEIGARVVANSTSLAHLAPAVRAEHERWDGAGYPDGLRGSAIPIASRIAFACDAFHAMTSDRPYRAAMDEAAALAELKANAGTQFDPAVVDAVLRVLRGSRPAPPPFREAGPRAGVERTRFACEDCGAHVLAVGSVSAAAGTCTNCGSEQLFPLQDELAPQPRPL